MPCAAEVPLPPRAKRCKHCEETGQDVENGAPLWKIQLDQDLLDTIVAVYPDWFKDYKADQGQAMAEGGSTGSSGPPSPPQGEEAPQPCGAATPPKAEVDDSPLQPCIDRNKESLKVKLSLRRPITQLVAQGIYPSLKTPPAYHEQRQKLERAKMGDMLKAKIQQRPDRQELVRQHILEADTDHVAPSLAENTRKLKKCKLADSLNDHLSHRPGVLELIQRNIMHADEPIERAVKEGHIPFKATCEGQVTKPQHPHRYITMDEDSQSSGESTAMSPVGGATVVVPRRLSGGSDVLEAAAANAGIVTLALSIPTSANAVFVTSPLLQQQRQVNNNGLALQMYGDLCGNVTYPAPSPVSVGSSTSSLSPLSSVASPPAASTCSAPSPITPRPSSASVVPPQLSPAAALASAAPLTVPLAQTHAALRTDAPGKDKNRKKSKTKTQPKTRTIKFHEYKGPPNAHKSNPLSSSPVETTYELLLQQQQLFLQVQRELQHMYPIILPAAQKPGNVMPSDSQTMSAHASTITANSGALSGIITSAANSATPVATNGTVIGAVDSGNSTLVLTTQATQPIPSPQTQPAPPVEPMQTQTVSVSSIQSVPQGSKALSKLEDMKVSDLKAELKKRSLPVSGAKPQLIERLRNFTEISGSSPKSCEMGPPSNSSIPNYSTDSSSVISGDESVMAMPMDTPSVPSPQTVREYSPPPSTIVMSPVSPASSPGDSQHDMDISEPALPMASPSANPVTPLSTPVHPSSVPPSPAPSSTPTHAPTPPPAVQVPPVPSPAPMPSPVMTEDIIREQQRKIEQLQKELLASKQQLQFFWNNKDPTPTSNPPAATVKPAAGGTGLNGVVHTGTQLDPGRTKKLLLQQHLQNRLQTLQRQHQQQEQLQQLQLQQQEQQQQQHLAFQQQQQGLNAKASLAAFLHQQAAILPTVNNNNDNISNNNIVNNKKQFKCANQQQQAATTALVLNRLNLQKQKGLAGIVNAATTNQHHRTNSLPNLIGSLVQLSASTTDNKATTTDQQQHRSSSVTPMATPESHCQPRTLVLTRNPTQPHFLTLTAVSPPPAHDRSSVTHLATPPSEHKPDKPPPQYEEVANLLKMKQDAATKTPSGRWSVKSQIVDDVLDILIKNGELPPSAAHDPTTPTTPGTSMTSQPVLFNATAPSPQMFNAESMFSDGGMFGGTGDSNAIFNDEIVFKSEGLEPPPVPTPSSSAVSTAPSVPPPPPPPPPPLPHTSFSVTLPTALSSTTGLNQAGDGNSFGVFGGNHTLDYILGSVNQAATTVDLKELGLDLETLDSMDFGQLDNAVKLEPADVDMDANPDAMNRNQRMPELQSAPSDPPPLEDSSDNSHLAEQLLAVSSELMDIGEMPMDMDDSDWLESLISRDDNPVSPPVANTPTSDPCHQIPVSSGANYTHYNGHSELDSYDPLLSNSQSPFDLLFEDSEFKVTGDLGTTLSWDKVDFAT